MSSSSRSPWLANADSSSAIFSRADIRVAFASISSDSNCFIRSDASLSLLSVKETFSRKTSRFFSTSPYSANCFSRSSIFSRHAFSFDSASSFEASAAFNSESKDCLDNSRASSASLIWSSKSRPKAANSVFCRFKRSSNSVFSTSLSFSTFSRACSRSLILPSTYSERCVSLLDTAIFANSSFCFKPAISSVRDLFVSSNCRTSSLICFESASRSSISRSKSASAFLWNVSNSTSRFFLEDLTFSISISNVSLSSRNFSASDSSERFDSSCSVKFLISNSIARCSTPSSSFSFDTLSFSSSNCSSKESFKADTEASSSSIIFFSLLAISEASESFDAYSEFFSSKLRVSSNILPSIDFTFPTNSSTLFLNSNFCSEKPSLAFMKRLSASISFDSVSACAESASLSFSSWVEPVSSADFWRRSNASVASAARVVAISASFSSFTTRWLKAIISSFIFCPSVDNVSISSRDLDSIVFNALTASSFMVIASSISDAFADNSFLSFSISDCKYSSLFIFSLKRLSRSEISVSARRVFSSFKSFKEALSSCNSFSICVMTNFIEFNSDSRDACACRKDSRASSKSFCNFAFFSTDSSTARFISASTAATLFAAACSLFFNESAISASFCLISFASFFCSLRACSNWAFTSFASSFLRFASSASFSFSSFASSSWDLTFLASESEAVSFAFTPFNSFLNSVNSCWDTMFCEEGDEDIEDDGCALVAVAFVFKEPSGCVIAANTSGVFNRQGSDDDDDDDDDASSLIDDDCSRASEEDASIAFTFPNVSKTGLKNPRRVEMASTGTEATNIAAPALKTGAALFVAWSWTCFFIFFCCCRCSFSAFFSNFSSFSRRRRSFLSSSILAARFSFSLFSRRSWFLSVLLLSRCCVFPCESTTAATFSRTPSSFTSFCSRSRCRSTCTTTRSPGNTKSKSTPGLSAFSASTSTPTYSESISTVSPGLNV